MRGFKKGDRVRQTVRVHNHDAGTEWEVFATAYPGAEYAVSVTHPQRGAYSFKAEEVELVGPEPDIKPGDRFRYTVEGVLHRDSQPLFVGSFPDADRDFELETSYGDDIVSIEKVEPPVTVFKPGDFVRRTEDQNLLYLAENGWVNMTRQRFYPSELVTKGEFRSDAGYEKVELHESPL